MSKLKILPLGGLGEIGMNCLVLEYQNEIIVIDCGLLFSDLDQFGVDFIIPDFTYLKERREKVKAFIITHGHEDHIGSLPFALKMGIVAPIYAPFFPSLLIRERLKEHGLDEKVQIRTTSAGETIKLGSFKITSVHVNHSIVDATSLIIDTPVGRIIHTADFKIDPTPYYGDIIDLDVFKHAGDKGVLLLLSDSTNIERRTHSLSDATVYKKFKELFSAAKGLTVVSMFSSNIARMGQVFELARKMDKKVAITGRSMEQNSRLGMEAGYLKDGLSVLIPLDDIDHYPREKVIVMSTGSQAEMRSALTRIANGEHAQVKLEKGDLVLMSSKFIPGNEKAIGRMINNLFRQGAEVLYESVSDIHVSGHAGRPELKKMLETVRPKFFIPVHGEYRHLVHHGRLAQECGVPPDNITIVENGDVIELSRKECVVVDQIEGQRILVEGRDGGDISRLVLKDRRQMGEKGVVFSLLVRNAKSRRIISGPEIIFKGIVSEALEPSLINEAKTIVKKVAKNYEQGIGSRGAALDLQETIRIELRRFFNQNIGKKPVVLPIVLDM
ncbi:MAG: ribonuclease J [Bdellovibrionota bacterium]